MCGDAAAHCGACRDDGVVCMAHGINGFPRPVEAPGWARPGVHAFCTVPWSGDVRRIESLVRERCWLMVEATDGSLGEAAGVGVLARMLRDLALHP
eukprot:4283376-Prorocentrum_lima.AAC.1